MDPEPPDPAQPAQLGVEPTTWVATRGTAWSAALALTILDIGGLRFRLFAVAILVGLPAFLGAVGHAGVAFSVLIGLAGAAFLLIACTAISTWSHARIFRRTFRPGLTLTCSVGPDHLVLGRDWTTTTVSFHAYDAVWEVDDWVFLRGRDSRVRFLYPRALFRTEDLARLRMAILGGPPSGQ